MKTYASFLLTLFVFTTSQAALYDKVLQKMQALEKANPGLVQLFKLGVNDTGSTVYGMQISKPNLPATASAQLVVGVHHGNEPESADVAMKFAEDILAQQQKPSETAFIKFADEIYYVIPVLNIQGYNNNRREEKNANGVSVDPNRDYPDPCGNPGQYKLTSTKALSNFVKDKNILGAVTVHGYIGTFTFPWGIFTDRTRTSDDAAFANWTNLAVKENGYDSGTHADVIYPTVGAFEDWAYYEHGVWVSLLEIANSPNITADSRSLLRYFSVLPNKRSTQHVHTGTCENFSRSAVKSRP